MQIIVDDLLTSYSRSGKGKTLVILPGWNDTATNWQAFVPLLSDNYDVIVLDLPGFGSSQAPPKAWDVSDYAGFVSSFVAKAAIVPFAYVGHSNGGAIAIRGLGSNVLAAEKLVLLASAGVRTSRSLRGWALTAAAKSAKPLLLPLPKATRDKLRRNAYGRLGSDLLAAPHMQDTFKLVVRDDVRPDAEHVAIPTLLIYGDKDTATPPKFGSLLAEKIKNSQLMLLPGVGHYVQQDRPTEVAGLVKDFLT